MEDSLADPVQFSKGINLQNLMDSNTEFHIDVDFNKKKKFESFLDGEDIYSDLDESDNDDSDTEEVLKSIEESTDKMMLSSPEYHSFDELAAKMINCTANGTVRMLVIEEGTGPLVPTDAEITFHYAAYWEKASVPFDSTLTMNAGEPVRQRIEQALPGIAIGLNMVQGPTAQVLLLLEPAVMWSPRGVPPRIKPERALFVISLYDVRDVHAASRFNQLSSTEQSKFEVTMKTVKSLNDHAKNLFEKKKYTKAIQDYQKVIYVLRLSKPETKEQEDELKQLKIKVYINLAVCYYKTEKPKYVIEMLNTLETIIDISSHCKGLFYYGRAYELLGKIDDAIKYYKKALELEPRNKEIGNALCKLDKYLKKSSKNEKHMWQSVFNGTDKKDGDGTDKKDGYTDLDDDFKSCAREMCQELAGRDDYAKFELPNGYSKKEIDYMKDLVKQFKGVVIEEDGEGRKKKVSIVKRILY